MENTDLLFPKGSPRLSGRASLATCACALLLACSPAEKAAETAADTWRYSRTLHFNTTPAGANVAGDVLNYPVAVALNSGSFDFSQAKPDGSDVRFIESAGGPALAHSIELWDPAGNTALLWVKVGQVFGNRDSQSIVMEWGNPNAAATSDPRAVFSQADGFVGVWHLGDPSGNEEGGYKDSTATEAHATGVNLTAETQADSLLGQGVALKNAGNQWIQVAGDKRKHFDLINQITFSIWAKADSYPNKGNPAIRALPGYETMFAKGDASWRIQKFGFRERHNPPSDLTEICVEQGTPKADLCVVGKTDMLLGQWYHFTGVHDHPRALYYVNGVFEAEETFPSEWVSGDWPVGIGNQSQFPDRGRSWDGMLDEARILNVPKDEHWAKLDYESQRPGQQFLTFGEVQGP
jgi:hypothetical protein